MPPATYHPIEEILTRHGVEPETAKYNAMNELRHWELKDLASLFAKVRRPSRDFCPFHNAQAFSDFKKRKLKGNKDSEEDPFEYFKKVWPSVWEKSQTWLSAPRSLMVESVEKRAALCVNKAGRWSLQTSRYIAVSHAWIEGLQREESNRSVSKNKIDLIFGALEEAKINVDWIWTDVLSIPGGGGATSSLEDDLLKIDLINTLPEVYTNAEAIVIFDALVWQLQSTEWSDVSAAIISGKWASRVWTYQEIKMAKKAYIITGTGKALLWNDIRDKLKEMASSDPRRYRGMWLRFAALAKDDDVAVCVRDIAFSCQRRVSGNDVDYARAFFPILGLKWQHGMSREEGMKKIYMSQTWDTTRVLFFHGHPRLKMRPAWAPSYITGLEGLITAELEWEGRGLRAKLLVSKILEVQHTFKRFQKQVLDLKLEEGTIQCVLAADERPEVFGNITNSITAGQGYVISAEWPEFEKGSGFARVVLLVQKAEVEEHDGLEVEVHCTASQTSETPYGATEQTILIRHGSPLDGNLENAIQYMWYKQSESSRAKDIPREEGESELHAAVRAGDLALVESLVSRGDSVDDLDVRGRSPIHNAAARGQDAILERLISKSEDLELRCKLLNEDTALSLAAEEGQAGTIKMLAKHGANIETRNKAKYTPLMIAALEGKLDAVHTLLELGADPNCHDGNGFSGSPLSNTCSRTHPTTDRVAIATALLDAGAHVSGGDHTLDWTPLHRAAEWSSEPVIELLIQRGANVNAQEKHTLWTPLRYAIVGSRREVVKLLIDAGADCDVVFQENWTPLHLAAQCADFEILRMILRQRPTTVNVRAGPQGLTPLHVGVSTKRAVVIKMLVEAGADTTLVVREGSGAGA